MLIIVIFLLLWIFLYLIGNYIAVKDSLQKSDAIIILSGTQGRLETLHERLKTGIKLFRQGWAHHIIVTGAFSGKVGKNNKPFSQEEIDKLIQSKRIYAHLAIHHLKQWDKSLGSKYMKNYLVTQDIPDVCIIEENRALNTVENAKFSLNIVKAHGWKKVILVTSPSHQRRGFTAFTKVNKDIEIRNYCADSMVWNSFFWFTRKENIRTVYKEITKILKDKS